MTHRSDAPAPASVLTVCLIGSNDSGCRPAATVQPPIRKVGVAADETTPHHGTSCISTTVREWPRMAVAGVPGPGGRTAAGGRSGGPPGETPAPHAPTARP